MADEAGIQVALPPGAHPDLAAHLGLGLASNEDLLEIAGLIAAEVTSRVQADTSLSQSIAEKEPGNRSRSPASGPCIP